MKEETRFDYLLVRVTALMVVLLTIVVVGIVHSTRYMVRRNYEILIENRANIENIKQEVKRLTERSHEE